MCTIFTALTGISVSNLTNFSYNDLITAGHSSARTEFPLSWWKNIARIAWSKIFRYLFWVLGLCSPSWKVGTLGLIDMLVFLFFLAISSPGLEDSVPKTLELLLSYPLDRVFYHQWMFILNTLANRHTLFKIFGITFVGVKGLVEITLKLGVLFMFKVLRDGFMFSILLFCSVKASRPYTYY